jgi:imidazole glycerol-phosphate synthase subunit HisH
MRIAIVNYGMGNLGSVRRAFQDLKAAAFIAEHPAALFDADRIVLPGVGSFAEAMSRLHADGWVEPLSKLVQRDNKPLLGICLGMQLLAASGDEHGPSAGLGFVEGNVRHLDSLGCDLRVPHIGWNDLTFVEQDPLFVHVPQHSDCYFVHSYAFVATHADSVIASTHYGVPVAAAVRSRHVFGTQFHPEKSSKVGRQILRNFLDYAPC